tara:strand:+ start:3970 stop:5043 length:1074 start_codon:yes stop_codon:yes gene_type:complete
MDKMELIRDREGAADAILVEIEKQIETETSGLTSVPELLAVEPSRAKQIEAVFAPMAKMLLGFEAQYNQIIESAGAGITSDVTKRAKALRLSIMKIRTETEKLRKTENKDLNLMKSANDAVSKLLQWAVSKKENKLKDIENHFEIEIKKKQDAIQSKRAEILNQYITSEAPGDLFKMADDVWNAYFATKKKDFEDRKRAEATARAEREAKEQAVKEEQRRLKAENEQLKKEQIEREEKARAEQRARDEKAKAEYEAMEAKLAAERADRERAEQKEREKREVAEAKLKAIEEEQKKAKQAAEQKRQDILKKGDLGTIELFKEDLNGLIDRYKCQSSENIQKIEKATGFIELAINALNI